MLGTLTEFFFEVKSQMRRLANFHFNSGGQVNGEHTDKYSLAAQDILQLLTGIHAGVVFKMKSRDPQFEQKCLINFDVGSESHGGSETPIAKASMTDMTGLMAMAVQALMQEPAWLLSLIEFCKTVEILNGDGEAIGNKGKTPLKYHLPFQ